MAWLKTEASDSVLVCCCGGCLGGCCLCRIILSLSLEVVTSEVVVRRSPDKTVNTAATCYAPTLSDMTTAPFLPPSSAEIVRNGCLLQLGGSGDGERAHLSLSPFASMAKTYP